MRRKEKNDDSDVVTGMKELWCWLHFQVGLRYYIYNPETEMGIMRIRGSV